jgi:hypothetical protein
MYIPILQYDLLKLFCLDRFNLKRWHVVIILASIMVIGVPTIAIVVPILRWKNTGTLSPSTITNITT